MPLCAAAVVLLLAAGAAAASLDGQAAVLPTAAAADLLKQCSRPSIDKPDSFWLPAEKDIAELERRLPEFLKRKEVEKPPQPLSAYDRQYVGVIVAGRRLIYGNFFPKTTAKDDPGQSWRKQPVVVCDGGHGYWGIVYDVKKRTFEAPAFNGFARRSPGKTIGPMAG